MASEYEKWATGLLSRVPDDDAQQIMDLLTRAPLRTLNRRPVVVWPNSVLDEALTPHGTPPSPSPPHHPCCLMWQVLDEATERAHPCMQFVAHPHCQAVLADYWHGNFVGSQAAIPKSKIWQVSLT
jgi:hypothetical protein